MSSAAHKGRDDTENDEPQLELPAPYAGKLDTAHIEQALLAPAREFLARPSKAFRARFIEASYALSGGDPHAVPRPCLEAVELLHAGSLIVDDIEDNADERRGGPALHRVLGTPRALNTGNWLYFVALQKLHDVALDATVSLAVMRRAHTCLAHCHEGQALDLGLAIADVKKSEVGVVAETTSRLKTGALLSFACALGGFSAGATTEELEALARFGENVGLALQMLDDVGSVVAPHRRAKAREDLRAQRVSWAWAFAAERLDDLSYMKLVRASARAEDADAVIARLSDVITDDGRARVHLALTHAFAALSEVFPDSRARQQLHGELIRLEQSYG